MPRQPWFKSSMKDFSIGELARRGGASASSIRYYERHRLLPVAHRRSGSRRYGGDDVARVRMIAAARRAGLGLAAIRRLVAGIDDRSALPLALAREIDAVDTRLAGLADLRAMLVAARDCDCAAILTCPSIAAGGAAPAEEGAA